MNAKKKSLKKIFYTLLFVILNVVVIALTAINEFGNSKSATELSEVGINWWLLVPAVILFLVATVANIYKYVIMIKKAYPANIKPQRKEVWKTAWRVVMLGKYYDNITPAAIGGQPFQIYYMHKHSRLKRGYTTSIPIVAMMAGQLGFLILAILFFIIGMPISSNPVLMIPAWLGLIFYAFWPAMLVGINFFPKATTNFLKLITKILAKLHIVKNRNEALKKVEDETNEYLKSAKIILKTRGLFLKTIVFAMVYHLLISSIPFFVLKAFGGDVGFFECLATTFAVTSAVYFIPTPGNSGAAEGTFYLVFSALSSGYVFWAMLIWRFFSYYIYIIMGPITYFFMKLEKKRGIM